MPKMEAWRSSPPNMRKALLLLALTACVDRPDRLPITETTRAKLAVHEWGTYTSLQGSDGRSMDGLHHAEHLLPPFVIARDATNLDQKAIPNLPEPVNQKLETPVIYFYGEYEEATVKVDFPGGVISEWYPDATAVAPPMDQLPSMSNGSMTWKVDLIDASDPSFAPPEVEANGIWAPSRRVS